MNTDGQVEGFGELEPGLVTRVLLAEIQVANCADPERLDVHWLHRAIDDALPLAYSREIKVKLLGPPCNIPQGP